MEVGSSFLYLPVFALIIQLSHLFLSIKTTLDHYRIPDLKIKNLINSLILLLYQMSEIVTCWNWIDWNRFFTDIQRKKLTIGDIYLL